MEEQIKTDIRGKITAGVYRLLLINRPNKQDKLENYAKIIKDDGSILKDYVCCTKCLQIFKNNSNLNTHRCFFGPCLRKLHTDGIDKPTPDFENETITITESPLKEEMKKSPLSIWEIFNLTLKDAGDTVDGLISCRQCNMILKYDNEIPSIALTHKCLAVKEGNCCLKDMPTQREIVAKIRLEISKNLNAGIYKLSLNRSDNSSLWRVYSLIERRDESILSGYVYCTKCKQILRNGGKFTNRLYKHECFSAATKTGGEVGITQPSSQESTDETISSLNNDSEEDIPIQISIWHTFVLTLRDNGNSVSALISCRLCNMTFKCETTTTKRQMHKCLAINEGESLQMLPSQRQIEDEINLEITNKIKSGIFKLKTNEVRRSRVWKVFALIVKTDGSILSGYACCIKCGKVKKVERMQANQLNRHSCFVNSQYKPSNKSNKNKRPFRKYSKKELEQKKSDIKNKISTGEYKLVMRENCKSVAWKFFANIIQNDGTPLERFLYCTKCTVVKSFDGTRTGDLRNHKCVLDYMDNRQEKGNSWSDNIISKDTNASQNLKNAKTINNHSYNIQHLLPGKIKTTAKNIQNKFVQEILNDQQPTIWSRFELIPLDDGSILEQMVSCRHCRMVLKYDGSTKQHLEDHTCFSMAPSLPITPIMNRNHIEFIPDSQQNPPIEKGTTNAAEKEINNGYSIMYMEEELNSQKATKYIEHNSLNESLPDIEAFQDSFSNEFTYNN